MCGLIRGLGELVGGAEVRTGVFGGKKEGVEGHALHSHIPILT